VDWVAKRIIEIGLDYGRFVVDSAFKEFRTSGFVILGNFKEETNESSYISKENLRQMQNC
jgi:hypothetical protein